MAAVVDIVVLLEVQAVRLSYLAGGINLTPHKLVINDMVVTDRAERGRAKLPSEGAFIIKELEIDSKIWGVV